jgi:hypothetical protein
MKTTAVKRSKPTKVELNKFYHLSDLSRMGLFANFAGTDYRSYRRIYQKDLASKNILNALVLHPDSGQGKRVKIKGENALRFVRLIEEGKYRL